MKLLSRLLIILTVNSLLTLVYILAVTTTLSSPKKLDSSFQEADAYNLIAKSLRTSLMSDLNAGEPTHDLTPIKKAIDKIVDGSAVRALLQPLLTSTTNWLNSKNDQRSAPDLTIDLRETKAKLTQQVKTESDQVSASQAAFELTRAVPDELNLVSPTKTESSPTRSPTVAYDFSGFKQVYQKTTNATGLLVLAVIIFSTLTFLLHLRNGKARFLKVAESFWLAALFTIIISFIVPWLLKITVLSNQSFSGVGKALADTGFFIIKAITRQSFIFSLYIAVIAVTITVLGLFTPKRIKKR